MPSVLRRDASRASRRVRRRAPAPSSNRPITSSRGAYRALRRAMPSSASSSPRASPAALRRRRTSSQAGGASAGAEPFVHHRHAATFPLRPRGRRVARTAARPPADAAGLLVSAEPEQHLAVHPQRLHQAIGMPRAAAQIHGLFIGRKRAVDFAALQVNMRDRHQVERAQDRQQVPREISPPAADSSNARSRSPCAR